MKALSLDFYPEAWCTKGVQLTTAFPQHPKVFVVDDERVIAFTLATILNQNGFRAVPFTDPLEALEAAGPEGPHLLISDVMMPELSGIELAIRLHEKCPQCKILLFSGQAATSDLLSDARRDGHHFRILTKPVHPSDLLNAIREFDAKHLTARDLATN